MTTTTIFVEVMLMMMMLAGLPFVGGPAQAARAMTLLRLRPGTPP